MNSHPQQRVALTFQYPSLEGASDGAQATFNVHLQNYAADLAARASRKAQHEILVKADVDTAAKELQPKSGRDRTKIVADWMKRTGFLFSGLSIAQVHTISQQKVIAPGSVWWLVIDVLVAAAGVIAGFFLDRSSLG